MGIIIPKNEKNNKKKMILRQNFCLVLTYSYL